MTTARPCRRRWLLLLLLALVCGCASQQPAPQMWSASSIANHAQDIKVVNWHDSSRKTKDASVDYVINTINTESVRQMIRVKERVENAAGELRSELLIAEGNEPNGYSFSHKGKQFITINIGMINLLGQDEDATAALIGHELAHLYLDHGRQRRAREENRAITTTILGFALGMVGIPIAAVDFTTNTIGKSFSREEERDADRLGVTFMTGAGFDPWGAAHLQESLGIASSRIRIPFLSTHPSNAERVENMKRLAEGQQ